MFPRYLRIVLLMVCAVLLLTAAQCDPQNCKFPFGKNRICKPVEKDPCKCTKEGYCPPCAPPTPEDDKPSP